MSNSENSLWKTTCAFDFSTLAPKYLYNPTWSSQEVVIYDGTYVHIYIYIYIQGETFSCIPHQVGWMWHICVSHLWWYIVYNVYQTYSFSLHAFIFFLSGFGPKVLQYSLLAQGVCLLLFRLRCCWGQGKQLEKHGLWAQSLEMLWEVQQKGANWPAVMNTRCMRAVYGAPNGKQLELVSAKKSASTSKTHLFWQ